MALTAYTFDPAATRQYLTLCAALYRDDYRWIPPLERRIQAQFAAGFPFYRKAGNAHRSFLATAAGRPVGHVTAFLNADLRDRDGTPVGAVGFFECIDDPVLAEELLAAARGWLAAEHDRHRVWGPLQFDIWHGYRLMSRGFDTEIFFGEPYNRPYYPALFERGGFAPRKTWQSVEIAGRAGLEAAGAPWAADRARAREDGYRFARLDVRNPAHVAALKCVIDDSYGGFLGFAPLTETEFATVLASYAPALDPRFVLGAWRSDGALVGFAVAYPDRAAAMRAMRGSASAAARLRCWLGSRHCHRAVFFMLGVTRAEAGRRRGVGRALFHECLGTLVAAGHTSVVFAMLAEDSPAWTVIGGHRADATKTYTLYEASLAS